MSAAPKCRKGNVKIFQKRLGSDPKGATGKAKASGRYRAEDQDPDSARYYAGAG